VSVQEGLRPADLRLSLVEKLPAGWRQLRGLALHLLNRLELVVFELRDHHNATLRPFQAWPQTLTGLRRAASRTVAERWWPAPEPSCRWDE
jgi:hypothetical protein